VEDLLEDDACCMKGEEKMRWLISPAWAGSLLR
jgi:hypothetical protein